MNLQKGTGSLKSRTEQRSLESKKSQTSHRLEGNKSSHRVEPQRKTPAGPMAASSQKAARKNFAVTSAVLSGKEVERVQSLYKHKESKTVHTNTPAVESTTLRSDHHGPTYTGDVNLMSIM